MYLYILVRRGFDIYNSILLNWCSWSEFQRELRYSPDLLFGHPLSKNEVSLIWKSFCLIWTVEGIQIFLNKIGWEGKIQPLDNLLILNTARSYSKAVLRCTQQPVCKLHTGYFSFWRVTAARPFWPSRVLFFPLQGCEGEFYFPHCDILLH